MMKKIMELAHRIRKAHEISMSQALKNAWREAKYRTNAKKYSLPIETTNAYSVLEGRIDHMRTVCGWSFEYAKRKVIAQFYWNEKKLFGNFEDIAKLSLFDFGEYMLEVTGGEGSM